jgi:hypothetical protein
MVTDSALRELDRRLRAAEQVCGLVGMNASDRQTERGKALTQAWMDWAHEYAGSAVPVSNKEIVDLAARRDHIVAETLARIERDYPEIVAARRSELPEESGPETSRGGA